jgi:hypothetical protein
MNAGGPIRLADVFAVEYWSGSGYVAKVERYGGRKSSWSTLAKLVAEAAQEPSFSRHPSRADIGYTHKNSQRFSALLVHFKHIHLSRASDGLLESEMQLFGRGFEGRLSFMQAMRFFGDWA